MKINPLILIPDDIACYITVWNVLSCHVATYADYTRFMYI